MMVGGLYYHEGGRGRALLEPLFSQEGFCFWDIGNRLRDVVICPVRVSVRASAHFFAPPPPTTTTATAPAAPPPGGGGGGGEEEEEEAGNQQHNSSQQQEEEEGGGGGATTTRWLPLLAPSLHLWQRIPSLTL